MKYSLDFSNITFCFHTRSLSKKLRVFFIPIFYREPRLRMILSLRCHSTKFVNFPILATLFVWQTQELVKFCMSVFFQKFMQLRFFNDKIRIWQLYFSQGNKIAKRFVFVDFCCQTSYPWENRKCHTRKSSYFFFFFAKISDTFAVWFYFFLHPFGGSSSHDLIWQFFLKVRLLLFESVFQEVRSWMFHFLWPCCERTFFPGRCDRWKNVPFSLASVCSNLELDRSWVVAKFCWVENLKYFIKT